MSSASPKSRAHYAGFYCAHHRWLDAHRGADALYKVGFTGDLRARLRNDAYITAFSEGWAYVFTFETVGATPSEAAAKAHLLETAVLHCLQARRLDGRELVEASRGEIEALVRSTSEALGLQGKLVDAPVYPPPPKRRGERAAAPAEKSGGSGPSALFGTAEKKAVSGLRLAPPSGGEGPVPPPEPEVAPEDVEAFLGELLGEGGGLPPDGVSVPKQQTLRGAMENLAIGRRAPPPPEGETAGPEGADWAERMRAMAATFEALPDTEDSCEAADDLADTLAPFEELVGQGEVPAALELRDYQAAARDACLSELTATRLAGAEGRGRAILQMACRCGKTLVAYEVLLEYLRSGAAAPAPRAGDGPRRVFFLVPGLSLLRQTVQKLARYGAAEGALLAGSGAEVLLVGSDTRPIDVGEEGCRAFRRAAGRPLAMTTDAAEIAGAFRTGAPLLVISTYQSSELLPDAADLTVFDEAHRVCGANSARPFTHVLLRHQRGDRLFMTATPRYDAPLSMKDRDLFGGVAYRYHMREGIDAGYVNDFSLEILGAPDPDAIAAAPAAGEPGLAGKFGALLGWAFNPKSDEGPAYSAMTALAAQVIEAVRRVDTLLVFCRSIRHAAELRQAVEDVAAYLRRPEIAASLGAPPPPEFVCLTAHSRMPRNEVGAALQRFCEPGARAVLFNCRLFQEGVEIPQLTGVFFAAPRHGPRDIIQSLCRPLNAMPGKPPSKVFVPVTYDPDAEPSDPANLKRFGSIVPFMDALMAEDPLLYEHLLDPAGTPYALRWVESRATAPGRAKLARYEPDLLLAAARLRARGSGRSERLLRAANIPWKIGFAELERIVRECKRYPKTTDMFVYGDAKKGGARVNFHNFYRLCADSYKKYLAREIQPLEPHQIHDLESLPSWTTYGVDGPYRFRESLDFLEEWLRTHGGVPPMVEINTGGFVGLTATPMERLSGVLTCYNQGDGKDRKGGRPGSGFTIEAWKQKALDDICARYKLRWRKIRGPPPEGAPEGAVGPFLKVDAKGGYADAPTFIQEAHARFKAEAKANKKESEYINKWFPQYFEGKHRKQEYLDVLEHKHAPPRWRRRCPKKAEKEEKASKPGLFRRYFGSGSTCG